MRNVCCILFLVSLAPLIASSSATAAAAGAPPSSPLGIVVSAENSRAGVDTNYAGATVYDGDRFATQNDGTMRLRLGNGNLLLFHATTATVHAVPLGFSVNLDSGTASAASSEGHTFELLVNGISITPADAHRAVAQVERVNSAEAILVVGQGNLKIAMGDEVRTVAAGNSYRLKIAGPEESSSSGEQAPQGAIPTGRNRNRLLIIVISTAAAVTGILIWRATVSPSAP